MVALSATRVRVWTDQFEAGQFPPVCALTGEPSETFLKFRFARYSGWWLLGVWYTAILWIISDRITGRLPLTNRSRRYVLLLRWVPRALLAGTLGLWILGAELGLGGQSTDPVNMSLWTAFFFVGLLAVVSGLTGALVVKPLACPRGRLRSAGRKEGDYVEISNLHPRFVAAMSADYASALAEASRTAEPIEL